MSMKLQGPAIILVLLTTLAGTWFMFSYEVDCGPVITDGIPMTIDGKTIIVSVAETAEERSTGLGEWKCLGKNEGMLYAYASPDFYAHNMKDMLFPLDIIWIDNDKKIVDVIRSVVPESYPSDMFINDFLAQYVLEVNAGFFDKNKLKLGNTVDFGGKDFVLK